MTQSASPHRTRTLASSTPADGSRPCSVRLRVRGADGQSRVLDVVASDMADAIRRAASRGLQVLAVELATEPNLAGGRGRAQFPLLLFTQELLALLEAGLNLTEALDTLLAK